ncbi:helix-turn-helix domain-containing protein [Streptomyces sp. NPDC048581]|uniref:nSTAND1 domain-containing NTPase n=1 Tax=unclassified Streptomyces TaxID=2593676 RepID=UPI003718996F
MGRPEADLDPGMGPVQRFAFELRKLRQEAGGITYRQMARQVEVSVATLSRAAKGEQLPSLPVALAYVRACGGDEQAWEQRWREAVTEQARAADLVADETAPSPYRGLARFDVGDAELFFGRDEMTDALARAVTEHRVFAVFGPSGSGKSSLLRAGLIPRLRSLEGPHRPAAVRILTPGEHPLRSHDTVCVPAPGEGDTWLVVDQFEEVFTLCHDTAERAGFLARLLAAAEPASRLHVVLGLRADFYGRCAEHRELADALREANLLVGPMSPAELREAVVRPAQAAGLIVERELTARLVEESGGEPGGLPLLSHALHETWRRRRGRALTMEAYEAAGGVHGAIAQTAEEVYTRLSAGHARLARLILLRLIAPGEGSQDTRRPVDRSELDLGTASPDDIALVLDRLARARLLTLDEDTVDLAHEALISAWPRLRGWIEEDRAHLRVHRRLTEAAHAWDGLGHDPGALYRGTRLAEAEDAFAAPDRRGGLTPLEAAFLTDSTAARRREQQAAARSTRRLRTLIAALAILAVIASAAAVTAFQQRATARTQRDIAIAQHVSAEADQLRGTEVSAQSQNVSVAAQLDIAAYRMNRSPQAYTNLINAAAAPLFSTLPGQADIDEAALSPDGRVLATVLTDGKIRLWDTTGHAAPKHFAHPVPGDKAAFSPRGDVLATVTESPDPNSTNSTLRLWDTTRPAHPTALSAPVRIDVANEMAFSPDGQTLAITADDDDGSGNTHVHLWDTSRPAHPRPLGTPILGEEAVFSPQGHILATAGAASGEYEVQLWDTTDPAQVKRLGTPLPGRAAAFSPRGHLLATTTATDDEPDGTVQLWDTTRPSQAKRLGAPLAVPHDSVAEMAFSPDGYALATAQNTTVRLWNVTNPDSPTALGRPLARPGTHTLTFTPDGHCLITVDETVRLWTLPPTFLTRRPGSVTAVSFSPDGHTLATAEDSPDSDTGGGVRLWNTTDPTRPQRRGTPLPGTVAAFGSRGRILATAATSTQGTGGALWLWDTTDPARPTLLRPALRVPVDGWISALAFSPDGRTLALAADQNKIWLWNTSTPARPKRHSRPLTTSTSDLVSVAFSSDGRTLIAGNYDDPYSFWDITAPERPKPVARPRTSLASFLAGGTTSFAAIANSPDGHTLATAGDDEDARLWNLADTPQPSLLGNPLKGHTEPVTAVTFSADGRTLATGSEDGTTLLWELNADRAIQRICAATEHTFSRKQWRQYVGAVAYQPPCP